MKRNAALLGIMVSMAGCSSPGSPESGHAGPRTLTIGASMTPQEFVIANPEFPFGEPLYPVGSSAPRGVDGIHNLVVLAADTKMKPLVLDQIGGGTIVAFSSLGCDKSAIGDSVSFSSAILTPTKGDGYFRQFRTLEEAYGDLSAVAEQLKGSNWDPELIRYESDTEWKQAEGVVPLAELEILWAREQPLVPPAVVSFRSGEATIECNLGFSRSHLDPDQLGGSEVQDRPLIRRPIFRSSCSVLRRCSLGS